MIKIEKEVVDRIYDNSVEEINLGETITLQAVVFSQNEFGESIPDHIIFEEGRALNFLAFFNSIPHEDDGKGNYLLRDSYRVESVDPLKLV